MKTFYKITLGRHFRGIESVHVEKETPATIIIAGDRKKKISSYHCYFSNLENAVNALQVHFSAEANQAEYNIQENKKLLKQFKKYLIELENYQT